MSEQARSCPSCQHIQRDEAAEFCAKCRFPLMLIAGKYRLVKLLGEGGFGYVYLAEHIRLKREAERVVKIIKPEVFRQDSSMQVRFEREVQMTSALSQKCQHIVRIYDDFGQIEPLGHFYVMEYLQGQPLSAFLKDANALPPIDWCVHVFCQMCDAIRRAHDVDIVHRDLKPDNLMLTSFDDEPHFLKVLDFGIAKPLDENGALAPHITKGFLGTPVYMAPELFGEDSVVDYRIDLYAMAIILYEMLTGRPPFMPSGNAQTSFFRMLNSHVKEAPPSPRALRPDRDIPEMLERVVLQALDKDPDERFQSALSFKESVKAAVGQSTETRRSLSPLPPSLLAGLESEGDILAQPTLTPHHTTPQPISETPLPPPPALPSPVILPPADVLFDEALGQSQTGDQTTVRPSRWKGHESHTQTPGPAQAAALSQPSASHTPAPLPMPPKLNPPPGLPSPSSFPAPPFPQTRPATGFPTPPKNPSTEFPSPGPSPSTKPSRLEAPEAEFPASPSTGFPPPFDPSSSEFPRGDQPPSDEVPTPPDGLPTPPDGLPTPPDGLPTPPGGSPTPPDGSPTLLDGSSAPPGLFEEEVPVEAKQAIASQEFPLDGALDPTSISRAAERPPNESKAPPKRTLLMSFGGVLGGLLLGVLVIFLSQSPKPAPPKGSDLPDLPRTSDHSGTPGTTQPQTAAPLQPKIRRYVAVPAPPRPRARKARRHRRRIRRRRYRRRHRRRHSGPPCPAKLKGLNWKYVEISPSSLRLTISQGQLRRAKNRRGYCVYFRTHAVQAQIGGGRYKLCKFRIFQLQRRLKLKLLHKRRSIGVENPGYCLKTR